MSSSGNSYSHVRVIVGLMKPSRTLASWIARIAVQTRLARTQIFLEVNILPKATIMWSIDQDSKSRDRM